MDATLFCSRRESPIDRVGETSRNYYIACRRGKARLRRVYGIQLIFAAWDGRVARECFCVAVGVLPAACVDALPRDRVPLSRNAPQRPATLRNATRRLFVTDVSCVCAVLFRQAAAGGYSTILRALLFSRAGGHGESALEAAMAGVGKNSAFFISKAGLCVCLDDNSCFACYCIETMRRTYNERAEGTHGELQLISCPRRG